MNLSGIRIRNTLIVDLLKLAKNYDNIREFVGKNVEVAATIKANGYGLGVEDIADSLSEAGCNKFFVFTLDEALKVRANSITDEVFVYNGIYAGEESLFQNHNIVPVVNTINQLELWLNFAMKKATKFPIVIQVDTGMTRSGIDYHDLVEYFQNNLSHINAKLEIKYVMSHLACSENENHPQNKSQLTKMLKLKELYPSLKYSLSNSAGLFLGEEYHFDLVRPGALLFGFIPGFKDIPFVEEITEYYSTISQVRIIKEDSYVGYDATILAKKGRKLALVSIGYADGYLRSFSEKGYCFIEDYKAPIVGTISMDCIIIDVTEIPDSLLYEGAPVEILGPNAKINDLASAANTCGWEVLVSLGNGKRYERIIAKH